MSTLLTSMETIVNPMPWLDRPRNAARLMAGICSPIGFVAIFPSLYGLILLWPLLFIAPGYALLYGYFRIARGKCKDAGSWWTFSIAYNSLFACLTAFLALQLRADADIPATTWILLFLGLPWQLFAIHLSIRGRRADENRPWTAD